MRDRLQKSTLHTRLRSATAGAVVAAFTVTPGKLIGACQQLAIFRVNGARVLQFLARLSRDDRTPGVA